MLYHSSHLPLGGNIYTNKEMGVVNGWTDVLYAFINVYSNNMSASSAFSADQLGSACMLRELVCLCLYVGQLSELAINFYCPT